MVIALIKVAVLLFVLLLLINGLCELGEEDNEW